MKHLCDDACFKVFRAKPTDFLHTGEGAGVQSCSYCQVAIPAVTKGMFELKMGRDTRRFCQSSCMADYKKRSKVCANCKKDVVLDSDAFMAPVADGSFHDFCSQGCLKKYEAHEKKTDDDEVEIVGTSRVTKRPGYQNLRSKPSAGQQKCSVCGKMAIVKHEVTFEGKVHRLCSDPCFAAFRYANKLALNTCDNCGVVCYNEGTSPQTIHFEGKVKRFCSVNCIDTFKKKRQKTVQCAWCGTKKTNFDMIERVDANSKFQLFCSLNCLSLYRVNLQATSNQNIGCDQCHKVLPAQYHLTMSDASVRNFCNYACVLAFQAQFTQPTTGGGTTSRTTPQKQSKHSLAPAPSTTKSSSTRMSSRGQYTLCLLS